MTRSLRSALLALLVSGLAAGALAAPAGAFQIGIQDDNAFVSAPPFERAVAFDRARRIGVTYLRINFVWAGYESTGFGPYDAAVDEARRHGMTVQLTVTGNPRWTNGGRGFVGFNRPNVGRYASWVGRVAQHFRGRVAYYAIWNEPNLNDYLAPQKVGRSWNGPLMYGRLFRAAYRAVKRNDARARVLIGEMAPAGKPLEFLATAARGGLVADGWAQHAYQFVNVPPNRRTGYTGAISRVFEQKARLSALARARVLRTPGGGPLPIYFTEFGYPRPGSYYGYFSEARRTQYSLQAFRLARRAGVRVLVWYQLYTHPGRTHAQLWDTGLIGFDGQQSPLYRQMLGARRSLAGF
jgi:hypothetical protein